MWPNYNNQNVSREHLLSTIILINEKFREGSTSSWDSLCNTTENSSHFDHYFNDITKLKLENLDNVTKAVYITNLINISQHLENETIRKNFLKYFSLDIWEYISSERLQQELSTHPALAKHWEHLQGQKHANKAPSIAASAPTTSSTAKKATPAKKGAKSKKRKADEPEASPTPVPESSSQSSQPTADTDSPPLPSLESSWFPTMLLYYMDTIEIHIPQQVNKSGEIAMKDILWLERFTELLHDLLSQLPTRRFLNTLLKDHYILLRCKHSHVYTQPQLYHSSLWVRLVDMLAICSSFEVNDQTGQPYTTNELIAIQSASIHKLQSCAFTRHPTLLKDLVFSSQGALADHIVLVKHLLLLSLFELVGLTKELGYISDRFLGCMKALYPSEDEYERRVTLYCHEIITSHTVPRSLQTDTLNRLSLYPSETHLWDPESVPRSQVYTGDRPVAVPKLNIQFLTMYDYLLRNFILYRLESAFEIREDLVDAIKRMGPKQGLRAGGIAGSTTVFGGWARMALPLTVPLAIEEVCTMCILYMPCIRGKSV